MQELSSYEAQKNYSYEGSRLDTVSVVGSPTTYRYLYDSHGNLDCIVKNSYAGSSCLKGSADLVTDYVYDDFDRLKAYESLGGASTSYDYDVLDRVEKEKETHPGFKRNVDFTYVGLTAQVATEVLDDPTSATPAARDVTKSYGYDALGFRLSLTNAPAITGSPGVGKAGTFTYAYDVHGSVSALLDSLGNVEATYGYDAYGGADPQLSIADNDPCCSSTPTGTPESAWTLARGRSTWGRDGSAPTPPASCSRTFTGGRCRTWGCRWIH